MCEIVCSSQNLLQTQTQGHQALQLNGMSLSDAVSWLDYPALYMCKPKRGVKRDDSKETYKLPHRLIEKKRRDRINECIAQLKDLLPEHLKLTTLGHLEKAVVLELTLKHLKALTALTEQQHQKIIALQNDTPLQAQGWKTLNGIPQSLLLVPGKGKAWMQHQQLLLVCFLPQSKGLEQPSIPATP
ncbi:basic helix-loop-helix family member e41 [Willisornis vidua]|uniref:Basic helix-loop-helix family member e41 n=1 Tax=Willisornis vidua TaxID=1566151 RepID=A0ABQ9DPQ3_9PASS|nr:basic helix-loop-helix family member e41 [Willisornis vidua]